MFIAGVLEWVDVREGGKIINLWLVLVQSMNLTQSVTHSQSVVTAANHRRALRWR